MHVNKEADYRGFGRASEATRRHDEFKGKIKKYLSVFCFQFSYLQLPKTLTFSELLLPCDTFFFS